MPASRYFKNYIAKYYLLLRPDAGEDVVEGPDHPALVYRYLSLGEIAGFASKTPESTRPFIDAWEGVSGDFSLALLPSARSVTAEDFAQAAALGFEAKNELWARLLHNKEMGDFGEWIALANQPSDKEKNSSSK